LRRQKVSLLDLFLRAEDALGDAFGPSIAIPSSMPSQPKNFKHPIAGEHLIRSVLQRDVESRRPRIALPDHRRPRSWLSMRRAVWRSVPSRAIRRIR